MEHYNTKKPEEKIDGAQFHLERKNVALHGDELLHYAVQKHDDLFLKSGTAACFLPYKNHGCMRLRDHRTLRFEAHGGGY